MLGYQRVFFQLAFIIKFGIFLGGDIFPFGNPRHTEASLWRWGWVLTKKKMGTSRNSIRCFCWSIYHRFCGWPNVLLRVGFKMGIDAIPPWRLIRSHVAMWTFKRPVDDVWLFLVVTNTGKTNGFAHWIYVILLELCHFCIHQKWINCKEYVNMSLLGHFLQSPIWLSNFQPMAQVFGGGWADSVRLLDNQDRRHWDFRVFEAPFLDDHTTRPFFGADVFLGEFISWSAPSGAVRDGTRIESGPGRKDSYIRDWFPELWDTPWYRRWALCILCILRCWEIAVETIGQSQLRL